MLANFVKDDTRYIVAMVVTWESIITVTVLAIHIQYITYHYSYVCSYLYDALNGDRVT